MACYFLHCCASSVPSRGIGVMEEMRGVEKRGSVAATWLEVGLIAIVGQFHNWLSRLNCGNRSAPVVATRLESQLRVDQSWIPAFPTPAPLPFQLHNIPVVTYFYPEIEIHLNGLVLRCNDNGCPTLFTVRLSQTSPQPWIRLARVPGMAYTSR